MGWRCNALPEALIYSCWRCMDAQRRGWVNVVKVVVGCCFCSFRMLYIFTASRLSPKWKHVKGHYKCLVDTRAMIDIGETNLVLNHDIMFCFPKCIFPWKSRLMVIPPRREIIQSQVHTDLTHSCRYICTKTILSYIRQCIISNKNKFWKNTMSCKYKKSLGTYLLVK